MYSLEEILEDESQYDRFFDGTEKPEKSAEEGVKKTPPHVWCQSVRSFVDQFSLGINFKKSQRKKMLTGLAVLLLFSAGCLGAYEIEPLTVIADEAQIQENTVPIEEITESTTEVQSESESSETTEISELESAINSPNNETVGVIQDNFKFGEDVYVQNGTYGTDTIKPGYYEVTGTGSVGRLTISDEFGTLVTNESVGTSKNATSLYTALIRDGYTVDVGGLEGLDSMIFKPITHSLRADLGPGIYTVGVDILSGEYQVNVNSGSGCLTVLTKNGIQKDSVLLGTGEISSEMSQTVYNVSLNTGDVVNVMMIESLTLTRV